MTPTTDDTFTIDVSFTHGNQSASSRVTVLARTENDATLTALQMVAARGMTPTRAVVDYENF